MTFYGQEKVEYNAQLCLMNMAVTKDANQSKMNEVDEKNERSLSEVLKASDFYKLEK